MDIEIARNPLASPDVLRDLINKYDGLDRDLGEALLLNNSLTSSTLSLLLKKCPLDLAILAIKHPHLSLEDQFGMISAINDDRIRTKAKLILLERIDLTPEVLAVLCLDPLLDIRKKAQEVLKKYDTYNYRR